MGYLHAPGGPLNPRPSGYSPIHSTIEPASVADTVIRARPDFFELPEIEQDAVLSMLGIRRADVRYEDVLGPKPVGPVIVPKPLPTPEELQQRALEERRRNDERQTQLETAVADFVAACSTRPTMSVKSHKAKIVTKKHLRFADTYDREGPPLGRGWKVATDGAKQHSETSSGRDQRESFWTPHLAVTSDGKLFQIRGHNECLEATAELALSASSLNQHYYGSAGGTEVIKRFVDDLERAKSTPPVTPRRVSKKEQKRLLKESYERIRAKGRSTSDIPRL